MPQDSAGGLDPMQHLLVEDVVPHSAPSFHVALRLKKIKQDRRMERPEAQGNKDWVKIGDTKDDLFSLRVWLARIFAINARRSEGSKGCLLCESSRPLAAAHLCTGNGACTYYVRTLYQRASSATKAAKYGLHCLRVTGYCALEERRWRGADSGPRRVAQLGAQAL